MDKRQLADGMVTVWMEGDKTIIHHANGLTLELTEAETSELRGWLNDQDAKWAERTSHLMKDEEWSDIDDKFVEF